VHVYSLEVGQPVEAKPSSAVTAAVKPEAPAPRNKSHGEHPRFDEADRDAAFLAVIVPLVLTLEAVRIEKHAGRIFEEDAVLGKILPGWLVDQ
jgi:hypothetical protein